MKKLLLSLCVLLFLAFQTSGQALLSSKQIGTMSAASVNSRLSTTFGAEHGLPPASTPIALHKITYRTPDVNGRNTVVSGLVALPLAGAPKGLVVYSHGTTADRNNVPSRYTGVPKPSEAEFAVLAFASGGYAVALPDFLGLGDHLGAHPYPLGKTNSQAAIDIIVPARRLARQQRIDVDSRLYVTGYSEGGAIAMWTLKNLEQMRGADYKVTAAAPLSGPYDLSGVTREWLIEETKGTEEFLARLYLSSYLIHSMHKNKGVRLRDYYNLIIANAVSRAYKGNPTDKKIIQNLGIASLISFSRGQLKNVFTDRFRRVIETLDLTDPVAKAMKENDVYDWSPQTPLLLVNLVNDKIVVPENTDKAFRTMRQRGVGRDTLRRYVIRDTSLDHGSAAPVAILQTRKFFDNGFANVSDED
jgi:pimeloyl-ACP methyl ester carboxylesterase